MTLFPDAAGHIRARSKEETLSESSLAVRTLGQTYHAMSLDLAKARLPRFPSGGLSVTGQDGEADAFEQLSALARAHGFVIK